MRLRLFRFQIVAVAVLALAIGAIVLAEFGSTESAWKIVNADKHFDDRVALDEELGVYLVERDSGIVALSNRGPWYEELDVYCPTSQLFETPRSGSKFDIYGRYLAGPAPRGMTRYPIKVRGDEILVDVSDPIPGPSRKETAKRVLQPVGPFCIPM